ncbi:MAG: hypothetical protein RTU92_05225 [Candidatus Thorarchaeota archaeon]
MRSKFVVPLLLLGLLLAVFPIFVEAPEPELYTIVIDYSHGQRSSYVEILDLELESNLTAMGYNVVWADAGLNSSILADAGALIIGSVYGAENYFRNSEIQAISSWYNTGGKFMWIAYDSDYGGAQPLLDNMTAILESVGSHVYAEPSQVSDPVSNCVEPYRIVATGTSMNPMVVETGLGVDKVLMHGPNLLYGSNSPTPAYGVNPVALETTTISNVYPILYYSENAEISDTDLIPPLAHDDGDVGAFVAATIEFGLGVDETGVLVVSGASPYGDYMPMYASEYYGVELNGDKFVKQTIDFCIQSSHDAIPPVISVSNTLMQVNSDITVNATIEDESEVILAILFYSDDGMATLSNTTMIYQSGDLWQATIPWPGYNKTIRYMVTAEDEYGNWGVSSIESITGVDVPTGFEPTSMYIVIGAGTGVIVILGIAYWTVRSRVKSSW